MAEKRLSRRRGVYLTAQGLEKLNRARRQVELQNNGGRRLTLEELGDRTQLSLKTITRVMEAKTTVDKQTIEAFFAAFHLALDRNDYGFPDELSPPLSAAPAPFVSWGEAIDVSLFYGRSQELQILKSWITVDGQQSPCRLLLLLGMGGMGKTALSIKLAQALQPDFEFIIWRSLRDAPRLSNILADLLPIVSRQQDVHLPAGQTAQIMRLMQYLRQHRCLLVLDNAETILRSGDAAGHYLAGYEDYGDLLHQVGEGVHQSCLILTSREKPGEIAALEGDCLPVRSYALPGLKADDSQALFQAKGLTGSSAEHQRLVERYRGNPLALKIVATSIRDLFGGSIPAFLQDNTIVFNGIRRLLQQQCDRISDLELQVMTWLAIQREWVSLAQLQENVGPAIGRQHLLDALEALSYRSLIERGDRGFTLQPVVMEYRVDSLLDVVLQDLIAWGQSDGASAVEGIPQPWFHSFPLIQASAKDYIRQSQVRVILAPLAERLQAQLYPKQRLEAHFRQVLARVRQLFAQTPSYSAGNLLNLLPYLELDLSGYDFSQLWIQQAYLVNSPLRQVNFTAAIFVQTVFAEPSTYSRAVAFSPQGNLLAAADFNQLRLWDMSSGRVLRSVPHYTWTWRLAFSPDGSLLASGSTDNVVQVLEVATGRCLKLLQGDAEGCSSVAFSPDGRVLAGSYHSQIRLWDNQTWTQIGALEGHTRRIAFVAIAPVADAQGRVIVASGSYDQTVRLWDLHRRQCLHILQGHHRIAWHLAFSGDGALLASSSMDGTIGLWDVATGSLRATLRGHQHIVSAATFIAGTDWLVSASFDHTLKYWDVHHGSCIHTTVAHEGDVWGVSSSPDGKQLVSVGNDKAVKLWDVATRQCHQTIQGISSQVYSVAFAGSSVLVSGGDDNLARLWDTATGACLQILEGHSSWVWAVAVSPLRSRLATAGGDGTIKVWDLTSGQCRRTLSGHAANIYGLAYSAAGRTLASGGADALAKLWDEESGACLQTFAGHHGWVWGCALATHHPWLATASEDNTLKLWDTGTGTCLKTFTGHQERVWAVALAADDQLMASGSEDYTAKLWDTSTGECICTFKGHSSQVKAIAFEPLGNRLVTASQDHTLKVWNLQGDCLLTLTGHTSGVSSLGFVPNCSQNDTSSTATLLASGSHDETVRLWDMQSGKCLRVLRSPRLYEGMILSQAQGLNEFAVTALQELGATYL